MKNIILLLLLFPFFALSQVNVNTQAPAILPVHPQVNTFTPYGNVPVGKYSGTASITVPLYTISVRGFDIPLVLHYNTTGVKVNEEASWVGLGWSLSEGGNIIQNVYGNDDYGNYRQRFLPDLGCIIEYQTGMTASSVMSTCSAFYSAQNNPQQKQANEQCGYHPSFAAGLWDSEPDHFTFNFMGYSGEFVMNWQTGEFTCLTDKRMKITSDYIDVNASNNPYYFTVKTPDGNKFVFQLKEETQYNAHSSQGPTGGIPVAVQLTNGVEKASRVYKLITIYTVNGETINFNYTQTVPSKNFPLITQKYTTWEQVTSNGQFGQTNGFSSTYSATEQPYTYLSSITFTGGEVKFITSARTDLKEAQKLDRVEVYSGAALLNSYNLSYGYFTGHTSGTNWDQYLSFYDYNVNKTPQELTQRLKLLSVTESGKPPYSFDYNPEPLPKKTSYATDYWGYYNGTATNNSFLENIYRFNILRDKVEYLETDNNNKSPSLQHTKAGVLQKITYPTGGYTSLDYELNSFDNYKVPLKEQGAQKYVNINSRAQSGFPVTHAVISTGGNTIFEGSAFLSTRGCTDPNAYQQFNIRIMRFNLAILPLVQNSSTNIVAQLYQQGFINGTNPAYNDYFEEEVWLQKTHDDPVEKQYQNLRYNLGPGLIVFIANGVCGTYSTTNTNIASMVLSYREYLPLEELSYGAGLRVKSVISQVDDFTPATYKAYTYEGGKLMTPITLFNSTAQTYEWKYTPTCPDCEEIDEQIRAKNLLRKQIWNGYVTNTSSQFAQAIMDIDAQIDALKEKAKIFGCECLIYDQLWYGFKNEIVSESYRSPSFNASGRYVGYNKVTETETSVFSGATNGFVEETYTNNPDLTGGSAGGVTGGGINTDLSVPFIKQFPENGFIKEQKILDKENKLKKHIINNYTSRTDGCAWGVKSAPNGTYVITVLDSYTIVTKYSIGAYPIKSGTTLLSKTTEKTYADDGINYLTKVTDYDYDSHNQLSYMKETNSENDLIETYFGYIYDYPISGTTPNYMLQKNMIEPIIRKEVKVNGETVQLERNYYKMWTVYLAGGGTDLTFVPDRKSIGTTGTDTGLTDLIFYSGYDDKANITTSIKPDGTITSYLWGYGGRYLIAVVENATYLQVINSGIDTATLSVMNPDQTAVINILDTLRQNLPNAHVTGFVHKPMVGIVYKVDTSGNRIKYVYDEYNRLKEVRDRNDNIIEEYKYHYRNQ